jgi:putative tryptophan/tyrosine transport system substrate-binding protein
MRRRFTPSLPGLTPQIGSTRLAALKNAQLGQARVAMQSILLRKKMDARVKPAHDGVSMARRRDFILALAGAAAAWPLAARAQQPATPVIGFLHVSSPEASGDRLRAFRQGLKDTGFTEGESVAVEYRWADNQIDRLPALATELLGRRVAVIVAPSLAPALAAKAATATTPIVFLVGEDPVRLGLVASLARPGGNLSGINFFVVELAAKRLQLLHELVPGATRIVVLLDANGANAEATVRELEVAARATALQMRIVNVGTGHEIDSAFAGFVRERPDALLVGSGSFLLDRRVQLALLAARHAVPAIYQDRLNAEAGGLISYGASLPDAYRQIGVHAGRILKGAKPGELPVMQSTKIELLINAQAARVLGLDVPPTLLARADEVIE